MMNEMPLVSIVIPIYNVEKYLHECLDNVVGQTYKNLDIILIDDGSPDNCGEICDEYAGNDSRIKVIHKANGGLCSARNAGINAAAGEWIYFMDSDDIIEKDLIETSLEKAVSDNSDMCFFDFDKFRGSERVSYRTISSNETLFQINDDVEILKTFFLKCGVVWTYIIKTKMIKNKVYFDESIKYHEDDLFKFLIYDKIRSFSYVHKILYHYRTADNSITQTVFQKKDYPDMVLTIHKSMINAVSKGNYPDNAEIVPNTKLLLRFPWVVRCAFGDRLSLKCDFEMIKKYMDSDEYRRALQNYDKNAVRGLSNRLYLAVKKPNLLYITMVYLLTKIKSKIKKKKY